MALLFTDGFDVQDFTEKWVSGVGTWTGLSGSPRFGVSGLVAISREAGSPQWMKPAQPATCQSPAASGSTWIMLHTPLAPSRCRVKARRRKRTVAQRC